MKQDIRHYSEQELSMLVLNDERLYKLMQKAIRVNNYSSFARYLAEEFDATDEQWDDLMSTYDEEMAEYENDNA